MNVEKDCPMCNGTGKLDCREDKMGLRRRIANRLREQDYTVREIMEMMGYKSPSNVHRLLDKKNK
jgi:hypothetical protein